MNRLNLIYRALTMLLLAAFTLTLAACDSGTGSSSNDQASKDFLAERSGTPATAATSSGGQPMVDQVPSGQPMPLIGKVDRVEGGKILVTKPMENTGATIELAPDAKITQQAEGQISDLKVGDDITAIGKQEGDSFTASMIQLGGMGDGMMMTLPMRGGPMAGGMGTPPAGGPPMGTPPTDMMQIGGPGGAGRPGGAPMGEPLTGKITALADGSLTVQQPDGKTATVTLAADAKVSKQVEVTLADIQPGTMIMAEGAEAGTVFRATAIRILPAMQMMQPMMQQP